METIEYNRISVKSDFGLHRRSYWKSEVILLSIYGTPQQTKAVFSALAENQAICVNSNINLYRPSSLKGRGKSIGKGKHHMLIWSDEYLSKGIIWFDDSLEKPQLKSLNSMEEKAFIRWLERKKTPYEREYLPALKQQLIMDDHIIVFNGWGGIHGYEIAIDDDTLSEIMLRIVIASKNNIHIGGDRVKSV